VQDVIGEKTVLEVERPTFIVSRFHTGNIMHTMHDDFIGLYHTIRRFMQGVFSDDVPEIAGIF
jgi:hypothetical protein